jgi:thymidylate synthase (FAD)
MSSGLFSFMKEFIEDNIGFVRLQDKFVNDVPLKIVNAARISYGTQKEQFDDKDKKLVNFLYNHGHTSPFRHSFYTFHIKAPISVFRQWIKYQVGSLWRQYELDNNSPDNTVSVDFIDLMFDTDKGCSWNELSRRYTQPKEEFYIPKELRSNPPHGNKQSSGEYNNPLKVYYVKYLHDPIQEMLEFSNKALQLYKRLIANGVAREQARDILPQNMYSEAYWTVSLQGVMHFLDQRLKKDAQHEIRSYAKCVYNLISEDLKVSGINLNEEDQH